VLAAVSLREMHSQQTLGNPCPNRQSAFNTNGGELLSPNAQSHISSYFCQGVIREISPLHLGNYLPAGYKENKFSQPNAAGFFTNLMYFSALKSNY
ncbi:MAG: hypothetical protein NZ933_09065, partial [Bacteroidia bacterium]|nr:hypothetical protein [Bacteroidia bacterium]